MFVVHRSLAPARAAGKREPGREAEGRPPERACATQAKAGAGPAEAVSETRPSAAPSSRVRAFSHATAQLPASHPPPPAPSPFLRASIGAFKKRFDPVLKEIEGWRVFVEPALLEGAYAEEWKRALTMLANHLQRIKILMLPDFPAPQSSFTGGKMQTGKVIGRGIQAALQERCRKSILARNFRISQRKTPH